MAPNPATTRDRLISAAEQLFAERGIDGVSLREINTAAGQRNSTALQYHFSDRRGLVRAVIDKHRATVDAERGDLLDAYEAESVGDLRMLAGALVRPEANRLSDPEGGREYLRIMAQLVSRFDVTARHEADDDTGGSIHRWRRLAADVLPEVAVQRLHRRFTAIRITHVELALRAERASRDQRLFTSHLVDMVTAILEAPLSAETTDLLGTVTGRANNRDRSGAV